jgi:hypothetical protein
MARPRGASRCTPVRGRGIPWAAGADGLNVNDTADVRVRARREQDLLPQRLRARSRSNVGNRSRRAIGKTRLEADAPKGRVALSKAHARLEVIAVEAAGSQRRNVVFTRPFSQGNILNETGAIVCQVADKRKGALRARLTRAMRCLLDGTNIAEAKVHNLTTRRLASLGRGDGQCEVDGYAAPAAAQKCCAGTYEQQRLVTPSSCVVCLRHQHRLHLKRRQLRMLAQNAGDDPGDVWCRKATYG